MREEVGDLDPRLTVLLELPCAAHQRCAGLDELALDLAERRRQLLPHKPVERGLRIESLHLARPADHVQEDHGFGLRLEMRPFGRERVEEFTILTGVQRFSVPREQIRKRERTETVGRVGEKIAAGGACRKVQSLILHNLWATFIVTLRQGLSLATKLMKRRCIYRGSGCRASDRTTRPAYPTTNSGFRLRLYTPRPQCN